MHVSAATMYSAPSEVESAIQSVLSSLNLHSLSTDELKELLNEDDKLNDKINDVGAVSTISSLYFLVKLQQLPIACTYCVWP